MSCASALSKVFPCFFSKAPAEPAQPKPDTDRPRNHIEPQARPDAAETQQNYRAATVNDESADPSGSGAAVASDAQQAQPNNKSVTNGQEPVSENEVTLIAQSDPKGKKNGKDDLNHKLEESAMSLVKDAPPTKPSGGGQHVGIVGEVGVLNGGVLGGGHVSSQMASSTSSRRESSHRASPHGEREGRSGTEGSSSVFEPRATPRTVFKKAPAHASPTSNNNNNNSNNTNTPGGAEKENNLPASRPSRPQPGQQESLIGGRVWESPVEEDSPTMQKSVNAVSDWISMDQQPKRGGSESFVQQQSRRLNDQQQERNASPHPANAFQPPLPPRQQAPEPSSPTAALAGYKELSFEGDGLPPPARDEAAQAAGQEEEEEEEVVVRDGDAECRPGRRVVVSRRWLDVPYFEQFAGLAGVLTRRGLNGVMWYAAFPGIIEQAFATGMHGQHVLAYAPADPAPDRLRGEAVAAAAAAATRDSGLMAEGGRHALPPRPTGDGALRRAEAGGGYGEDGVLRRGGGGEGFVVDLRGREAERRSELREQAAAEQLAQQRQPQNKDAVQDASLAVATDAPLAAPRGGKRSARAPLSARDKLEKRPPSARSRSQMGAPPLGSGRRPGPSPAVSARRLGGSATPDVGLSPREEWTPDSPREGGREGRLFKFPEWDEYELFDSDDLWSEHAYLLYGESMAAGEGPSVFVWLGQYFEEADYADDTACERFAVLAAQDFRRAFSGAPVGPITVVKELEEEEDFWEYFVLG